MHRTKSCPTFCPPSIIHYTWRYLTITWMSLRTLKMKRTVLRQWELKMTGCLESLQTATYLSVVITLSVFVSDCRQCCLRRYSGRFCSGGQDCSTQHFGSPDKEMPFPLASVKPPVRSAAWLKTIVLFVLLHTSV